MNALLSGLMNGKTTSAGALAGTALITQALRQQDLASQVIGVIAGVLVFVMGLLAKDSTTGSQPG